MTDQSLTAPSQRLEQQEATLLRKIQVLENKVDLLLEKQDATGTPAVIDPMQKQKYGKNKKLIREYLINECATLLELHIDDFFSSTILEYREARMICIHLYMVTTQLSLSKVGHDFSFSKRKTQYCIERCRDRLAAPSFYKTFMERYHTIEQHLKIFVHLLNQSDNHDQH